MKRMHCVICTVHPLFATALSLEALAAYNEAEQKRIQEEELFAEIERDWYADEETPIRTEEAEDDWDDLFDEEAQYEDVPHLQPRRRRPCLGEAPFRRPAVQEGRGSERL